MHQFLIIKTRNNINNCFYKKRPNIDQYMTFPYWKFQTKNNQIQSCQQYLLWISQLSHNTDLIKNIKQFLLFCFEFPKFTARALPQIQSTKSGYIYPNLQGQGEALFKLLGYGEAFFSGDNFSSLKTEYVFHYIPFQQDYLRFYPITQSILFPLGLYAFILDPIEIGVLSRLAK